MNQPQDVKGEAAGGRAKGGGKWNVVKKGKRGKYMQAKYIHNGGVDKGAESAANLGKKKQHTGGGGLFGGI